MNNSFGYYREVNGRLMCFATEAEYYEYVEALNEE